MPDSYPDGAALVVGGSGDVGSAICEELARKTASTLY